MDDENKKRGPVKKKHVATNVRLDPDDIDWAKEQPEGMSAVLREALKQYRKRAEKK